MIIREWAKSNLLNRIGNPTAKKCKIDWFKKYNFMDKWNQICEETFFLNKFNSPVKQRLWHIINNVGFIKCGNPVCNNPPTFFSFNRGYLTACCSLCAQSNPVTIDKIKSSNLRKYGKEYGLSNVGVINKRKVTVKERYGVDNISQADGISDKKKSTCLKNHGVEWILSDQKLKEECVFKKYGVNNVRQVAAIANKISNTRRGDFFDTLINSDRLRGRYAVLFTREEYISGGYYGNYKFKCLVCNTEFVDCLEDGDIPRCQTCYKSSSIFEEEVTKYIKMLLPNIDIKSRDKTILNGKELDIYIPSLNIGIECDGLFWHGEIGGMKNKSYHLNKTIECEKQGIHLIHIFEDEWLFNKDIVYNKLKHILKQSTDKLYARACDIRSIDNVDKKRFLNVNHIQGNDVSSICYGLFHKDELVSLMTFGKSRVFMNTTSVVGQYELIRYASNKTVVGGASKLLNHFIKIHKPYKVISYADRRWTHSVKNLYASIGFKKISDGTPNYWYFGKDKNYRRHHRFGFAKHTLSKKFVNFDSNLSEWQNMQNNGYDRIWDCGHLKYELIC